MEGLRFYLKQQVLAPVYDWCIGNYWQQQELLEGEGDRHRVMFPRPFADFFLSKPGMPEEKHKELQKMLGDALMVPGSLDRNQNVSIDCKYGENFHLAHRDWDKDG